MLKSPFIQVITSVPSATDSLKSVHAWITTLSHRSNIWLKTMLKDSFGKVKGEIEFIDFNVSFHLAGKQIEVMWTVDITLFYFSCGLKRIDKTLVKDSWLIKTREEKK